MHKIIQGQDAPVQPISEGVGRRIGAWAQNLMPVEWHFKKGCGPAPHSHPHEQVSYVVRGKFQFETEGCLYVLQPGDSLYFGPNVQHGLVALEDGIVLDIFTPCREDFLK